MHPSEEVHFLGHVTNKTGLKADSEKVTAPKKFPIPQNQTDVKSLLGLRSFYQRYIKHFVAIARLLNETSETRSPCTWTEEAHGAFKLTFFVSPLVMQPFKLYTDASLTAKGALLAHIPYGKESAVW